MRYLHLLHLDDDVIDEGLRCESGIDQEVDDMHGPVERNRNYLPTEIPVLIKLEVHLTFDVVLRYARKALLPKG